MCLFLKLLNLPALLQTYSEAISEGLLFSFAFRQNMSGRLQRVGHFIYDIHGGITSIHRDVILACEYPDQFK